MKLWDRTQPLKSVFVIALGAFVLLELVLLFGNRWILVSQTTYEASNAFYSNSKFDVSPATDWWTEYLCTYWTGRGVQQVTISARYSAIRECRFFVEAPR